LFQGIYTGLSDMPGSNEIGLAYAKRDNVFHGGKQIEELPDA